MYIQIDTTVPKESWSEFLFKGDEKRARLKSCKLRGKVSQGLCLPLHILPNVDSIDGLMGVTEGYDVTEILGIQKYEKPAPKSQDALGNFPTDLVAKTDEERVQNVPEVIEELRGKPYVITKKMDGTSVTFIKHENELRVFS